MSPETTQCLIAAGKVHAHIVMRYCGFEYAFCHEYLAGTHVHAGAMATRDASASIQ